jgi:hypothetical protein
VAAGEPLWLEADRLEMIGFLRWKRTICGSCGTSHADFFDDEGMPLDDPPYVAITHRCQGCATKAAHDSSRTGSNDRATRTVLVPPSVADAIMGSIPEE